MDILDPRVLKAFKQAREADYLIRTGQIDPKTLKPTPLPANVKPMPLNRPQK